MKNDKPKKPIYKRWWFWLIIVSVIFAAVSPKNETAQTSANTAAEQTADAAAASGLSFTISADAPGEYGRETVLNAGTEDEYHYYAFYIPAGDYRVTNSSKGAVQVSFCDEGIYTRDDGMEELIPAEQKPIVVMAGENATFHINDGQYIKLSDGASQVHLEKLGE